MVFLFLNEIFAILFQTRQISYMGAMIVGNIFAVLNAFITHKYLTFQSRVRGLAVLTELVRFSTTYLFSFVLGLFLLPAFVEILGIPVALAGALVILVCMVISYLGHSRFSFRKITP